MINGLTSRAAAAAFLILAGCSSILAPQPDPSKFFVLSATTTPASPAVGTGASLSIGLGPVRIPSYLSERDEIATRTSPNQMEYSTTYRWAEALDTDFSRVLGKDLANALGGVQIVTYPWFKSTPIDYAIEVEVERFESVQGGDSELSARWTIRDGKSDKVLLSQVSSIHHATQSKEPEASVAALSANLGDLSDQIATALRGLEEQNSRHAQTSGAS